MKFPHRSATPNAFFTGVRDNPRPGAAQSPTAFPLHTVLNWVVASWGTTSDAIAINGSAELEQHFGKDILSVVNPNFNYQSTLTQMLLGKANAMFIQRLDMPDSAKAAGRLSLEYVEADVEPYERNPDGSFKLDGQGDKIATGSTGAGYKFRLIWEASDGDMVIGSGTQGVGTLVGKDGSAAVVVPIADIPATYKGKRGNFNVKFYQPKALPGESLDTETIEQIGSLIYRLGVSETPAGGGSLTPWYTNLGQETVDFAIAENTIDANGALIDFPEVYRNNYVLTGQDSSGKDHAGPIDDLYFYQTNIASVLALFHAAEKAAKPLGNESVFIHDTNIHSINLLGDTDYNDRPYRALVEAGYADDAPHAGHVMLDSSATVKLGGGSDGTVSDANYNKAIRDWVAGFGIANSLHNLRQYPFAWVYDMGLENATTEELYKLSGKRPDIAFVGSVHEHGANDTMETMLTKATSLAAAAALVPESTIFSTPSTRGFLVPLSLRIRNSQYRHPVSLAYALAEKISDYAGSADGVWRRNKDPLHPRNKGIEHEVIGYRYMPLEFRESMWANQLVMIENLSHNKLGFSAIQTVNPNDSSILNSLVGVLGIQAATIAASNTYARWVGITETAGVLIDNCNEDITAATAGVDASKVRITPDTKITPADYDSGYAWTMESEVLSGPQFTAATVIINSGYLEAIA